MNRDIKMKLPTTIRCMKYIRAANSSIECPLTDLIQVYMTKFQSSPMITMKIEVKASMKVLKFSRG